MTSEHAAVRSHDTANKALRFGSRTFVKERMKVLLHSAARITEAQIDDATFLGVRQSLRINLRLTASTFIGKTVTRFQRDPGISNDTI